MGNVRSRRKDIDGTAGAGYHLFLPGRRIARRIVKKNSQEKSLENSQEHSLENNQENSQKK